MKINGKVTLDSKLKADAMNCLFLSVFIHGTAFDEQIAKQSCLKVQMPHIDITTADVLKLLQELNPGKAPGPDVITPWQRFSSGVPLELWGSAQGL